MDLQGCRVFLLFLTSLSFLLPAAVGMDIDDKPLLFQIRNFPTAKGKTTDLSAKIVDYSQFSSCLLQDEGSQLKGIVAGHGPKPKDIMNEVFSEWITGKGKNPVTWKTLISCLEMTGFREQAGELKKVINGGLSIEEGDGGGDSEYCSADGHSGDCYPIKRKTDLFDATQEIGKWKELCDYLGVSEGVLEELDYSGKSVRQKKHDCLTDHYNNHNPNWRKVVSVVAKYPIMNLNVACKIAKKHMKVEERECEKLFRPKA